LAVQGAQIEARDVIAGKSKDIKENSEEEWSVIDLKDDKSLMNKENLNSKGKSNHGSTLKQIKGAASVFGFVNSSKHEKSIFDSPSLNTKGKQQGEGVSILMEESGPLEPGKESGGGGGSEKWKRKPFRTLFHKEQREGNGGSEVEQRGGKSAKKQWGFDGFKKWKRNENELDDETAPLPLNQRSDSEAFSASSQSFARTVGDGPDTKLIKKKLHSDGSPSDFFIDKVISHPSNCCIHVVNTSVIIGSGLDVKILRPVCIKI
jgi:hypothetical protein